MRVELIKTFQFEAAHTTPWQDDPVRLHGHSFAVEIVLAGECDPQFGWLMDYAVVTEHFNALYAMLDHKTLNEVEGLSDPTAGGVREWILERLRPQLEGLADVRVSIVGEQLFAPKLLHADPEARLSERIRFGFEAAHALPNLPPDHKCHTMHGHSFVVEVGAGDADEIVPALQEMHDRLDHRCLNELPGLENPTSEVLSRWIWDALAERVADLRTVMVAETCTARCIYRGP